MNIKIPIVGAAYIGQSVNISAQRCVNLFPVSEGDSTKGVAALVGTPGLKLFGTVGSSPARGAHAFADALYVVSDYYLYKVLANATVTQIGTLQSSSGRVSMADNGTQLVIVDGSKGYLYNKNTGAFGLIVDTDFPVADVVCFIDGYFIVNKAGTGTFYISAAYDGLTWDGLDFATAEGDPDTLMTVINSHRDLWLLGELSGEVWVNTGASAFPYERMNGAFMEVGCAARWSVCRADSSLFWLARDRSGRGYVVRADGYSPAAISTPAIEHAINRYADISDAKGYVYRQDGHTFYVLTFPAANATWVYDASTGLWHERESYGVGRHRGDCYAFVFGKHLVTDYANGNIYELDYNTYTDNGQPKVWKRTGPHLAGNGERVRINKLTLDMETGVGDSTKAVDAPGTAADPQVSLRWSDDGGHTWSGRHMTTMGKIGVYHTRAIWRRLGTSRDRVFEISGSDAVKVAIVGADLDITQGVS